MNRGTALCKKAAALGVLAAAMSFPLCGYAMETVLSGAPGMTVVSERPEDAFRTFEYGPDFMGSGPQAEAGGSTASWETSVALSGNYVKPSYWRGDVYCADSCVSDGNGGWIYNDTDAYHPTQGSLYKLIREEGDWYVCENFGNDLWLRKSHCTAVNAYDTGVALSETRKKILAAAFEQLGKPYVYGAAGPDSFDCSGFVNYCYQQAGIGLPRSSSEMGALLNISREELLPGDIVWREGHVGIYMGNGEVIHAAGTDTGVVAGDTPEAYTGYIRLAD